MKKKLTTFIGLLLLIAGLQFVMAPQSSLIGQTYRILVRRGLAADLPALATGEFGFSTDTKELHIGSAVGNLRVMGDYITPEMYGAKGDGVTDDTAAIQAAIDAAEDGEVHLSKKTYCHTGLSITHNLKLTGVGWDFYGSVLFNIGVGTGLTIINDDYTGCILSDLCLKGSATTGNALDLRGEGQTTFRNVYLLNGGGYGIKFLNGGHTSIVRLSNCRIQNMALDGIYGRSEPTAQINGINILDCEITANDGDGINLWANNLNIERNVIQGNDGAGIRLTGSDMITGDASISGVNIFNNYFELNKGGSIAGITEYNVVGPIVHYCWNLRIEGNRLSLSAAQANPGITAQIDLSGTTDSGTEYTGLFIGPNSYHDDLDYIDLNYKADTSCIVVVGQGTLVTKYKQLNNAHVISSQTLYSNEDGNVGIKQTTFGGAGTKILAIATGVAPTTSPADSFQQYSADAGAVAGQAGPHFRTEGGGIFGLRSDTGTTLQYVYQADALADDGTVVLPDATSGMVIVSCNAEAGMWLVQADGTVTKISGSTNTAAADTDANLCVYDGGTGAIVKNRLGATGEIRIVYYYN